MIEGAKLGTNFAVIDYSGGDVTNMNVNGASPRALHVGVGGTIKFDGLDGGVGITSTFGAGVYPYVFKKIYQTGTTATGLMLVG